MRVKQVSVFVENEPGRLMGILEVLEKRGISIRGLSVSDAAEIGIVRMILTDSEQAFKELKLAGFTARMDWVLSVEVPDVPGGLLRAVAKPAAEAGVNLLYFYGYTEPTTAKTMAVIKVDNLERAEEVLKP
jgi:hypothetical protein